MNPGNIHTTFNVYIKPGDNKSIPSDWNNIPPPKTINFIVEQRKKYEEVISKAGSKNDQLTISTYGVKNENDSGELKIIINKNKNKNKNKN